MRGQFKGFYRSFLFTICLFLFFQCQSGLPIPPDSSPLEETTGQREKSAAEFALWAQTLQSESPELTVGQGHTSAVNGLALTPDGRFLLTGSSDGTVKLWDTRNSRVVRSFRGHEDRVFSVALSPDGQYAASGSEDQTVKLWEISSGNMKGNFQGHSDTVMSLSFSPDGQFLLSGSKDETAILWDRSSGRMAKAFRGHDSPVNGVAFSPDGTQMVTGSSDHTVILWDIGTGDPLRTFEEHTSPVSTVSFSPDGEHILSGRAGENELMFWKASSGRVLWKIDGAESWESELKHEAFNQHQVSFSPKGEYIAYGSWEKTVNILDSRTGEEIQEMTGHKAPVLCVSFSPLGDAIVSGSVDRTARLWDFPAGGLRRVMESLTQPIMQFKTVSDERYIYTSSNTGKVNQVDISSGRIVHSINLPADFVYTMAVSRDEKNIAAVLPENTIRVWEMATMTERYTLKGLDKRINHLEFSPEGRYLASASIDQTVRLWDLQTGRELPASPLRASNRESYEDFRFVRFSPDSSQVLAVIWNDAILWDYTNGREIRRFSLDRGLIRSVAFSEDGTLIAAGTSDGDLKVWERDTGSERPLEANHNNSVGSLSFSRDGRFLLTGSDDGILKVSDLSQGREILSYQDHTGPISGAGIYPERNLVLSASIDSNIKYWDFNPTVPLKSASSPLLSLIYTEQGERLLWTHEGFFSGDEALAGSALYIVDGLQTISIEQFFDTYYRPDIIDAKLAGIDVAALTADQNVTDVLVPLPDVHITWEAPDGSYIAFPGGFSLENGRISLRVTARDNGGGAQGIRLFHNGSRVADSTRGLGVLRPGETSRDFVIQLLDGKNTFRAVAFTESQIESSPFLLDLTYKAPDIRDPVLWMLAVGINEYRNPRYALNYATKDALAFVEAVERSSRGLFSRIETQVITNGRATRENLLSAIEDVSSQAKPEDVFLFFYAGHGIALDIDENGTTDFHFIPADVTQMTDNSQVADNGISGPEFEDLLSRVPPLKQFIVLDACNSGAINSAFAFRGAAEEIAMKRLVRATGSALIAASRDDQFAQEFAQLGQGALTKSLLDGLAGEAALPDGLITVGALKSYVEAVLPDITEQYSGQVQFPTGFILGQDFPIGRK